MNRFTFATLNYQHFECGLDTLATLLEPATDADVLVLCEATGSEHDGSRLRLNVQALVKNLWGEPAQAFASFEERGPLPKLTVVRSSRIDPVQHWPDPLDFETTHRAKAGQLACRFDGVDETVTVEAVHLDPYDGDARLAWAKSKGNGTAPGALHVKLGDFNALWPGHPELDWSGRLPHHAHHKTQPTIDGRRASDLRAMSELARQGWGFAAALAGDWTPTVNPHGPDPVCPTVDGALFSSALTSAVLAETYRVHEPDPATSRPNGEPATDHRLVVVSADFEARQA